MLCAAQNDATTSGTKTTHRSCLEAHPTQFLFGVVYSIRVVMTYVQRSQVSLLVEVGCHVVLPVHSLQFDANYYYGH